MEAVEDVRPSLVVRVMANVLEKLIGGNVDSTKVH
jgi:hypothetical protein